MKAVSMTASRRLRSAALAGLLGLGAPWSGPTDAQTVVPAISSAAEAQDFLEQPDIENRTAAVLWLGKHGGASDALGMIARLHDPIPEIRALAEQALWLMWGRSGDGDLDAKLAHGSEAMNRGDLEGAIATFSEIVVRRPDFVEGWNKRATARYLAGELAKSMADCDEVLARNPLHFGALSGYGLILAKLEQYERALDYFRKALAVNPGMDGVRANIAGIERLLDERRRRST